MAQKQAIKQKEYFGVGSIKKLAIILAKTKSRKIFLVRGKKSYEVSGAQKIIAPILDGYRVFEFYDFETNPKIEDIKKGIGKFRKFNPDLVLAVGGGSVIDVAKSINFLAAQNGLAQSYVIGEKKAKRRGKKLVAVPTTAGSGSKATHFAVAYINKTKYSLDDKYLLPDYAIVDPCFTFNLPKEITAVTGMDALSQAIESYWSINSDRFSKIYSKKAIGLIVKNLPLAVRNPDKHARMAMSKAANLAGKAINIAKTTACHAVSHPITSFFGVPHGQAAALTLGEMLVYNGNVGENDALDARGVAYVKKTIASLVKMLDVSDIRQGKLAINRLMEKIGLETKLSKLGIDKNGRELIIKNGFNPERMKNNPRKLDIEQLRRILDNLR